MSNLRFQIKPFKKKKTVHLTSIYEDADEARTPKLSLLILAWKRLK